MNELSLHPPGAGWWSIFARLAEPDKHRESITSRPLLLNAPARRIDHARQRRLLISHPHAEAHWVRGQVAELDAEVAGALLPLFIRRLERTLAEWEASLWANRRTPWARGRCRWPPSPGPARLEAPAFGAGCTTACAWADASRCTAPSSAPAEAASGS
jgi:hypothetical protein